MKAGLLSLVFLFLCGGLFCQQTYEYTVGPGQQYSTITSALAAVNTTGNYTNDVHIVHIYPNTNDTPYNEQRLRVTTSKQVTLIAAEGYIGNNICIRMYNSTSSYFIYWYSGGYITLKTLLLWWTQVVQMSFSIVDVSGSTSLSIKNCISVQAQQILYHAQFDSIHQRGHLLPQSKIRNSMAALKP
jgi:hypothetical protein